MGGYFVSVSRQTRRVAEQPQFCLVAIRDGEKITVVRVVGANLFTNVVIREDIAKEAEKDSRVQLTKKNSEVEYERVFHEVIQEIEAREAQKYNDQHNTVRALEVGSIDELVELKDFYSVTSQHFLEAIKAHHAYWPTRQRLELSRHTERAAKLLPHEIARGLIDGFRNSGLKDPNQQALEVAELLQKLAREGGE